MNGARLRWLAVVAPVVAIGALDLITDHELSDLQSAPLNTLAVPVIGLGFAITFARISFRRIDRRTTALAAMRDLGEAIASLARTDLVLGLVVERARVLLGSDVAFIAMLRADATYELTARSGADEAFAPCDAPPHDPGAFVHRSVLAATLTAPLIRGDATVGLLVVARQRRVAFRHDEGELLASFASTAAIALENARLQQELRELAIRSERERIAREMHDGLAQVLGYVNTKAQAVEHLIGTGQTEAARRQLAELGAAARAVYADVREAILGLSSPIAADRGLVGALEEYTVRFSAAAEVATDVEASRAAHDLRLPPQTQAEVFRIAQEALTNIRKHAAAHRARLQLDVADRSLLLAIEDDGVGFDPATEAAADWPHFGMRSIRERARSIGAAVEWSAGPGTGTRFQLTVPVAPR